MPGRRIGEKLNFSGLPFDFSKIIDLASDDDIERVGQHGFSHYSQPALPSHCDTSANVATGV